MPIYEYRCRKCGEVIERIQKFSDPPLRRHAGCGGTLAKLVSQSAFQLKGSGWYVTDYARAGTDKKSDGAESPDAPAAASTAKDEKPDKQPDKQPDKRPDKQSETKPQKSGSAEASGSAKK